MAVNNRTTVWNMGKARSLARALGGALALTAMAWTQLALAQGAVRLTAVEVQPMQGSTLQIRLRTDGVAPQPLTFTIDQPARLSVDLPDVALGLENRRIDVGAGGVDTIVAAEATGRTRVVFNLDALVPYTAVADGDSVVVTLGSGAAASYAAAPASSASSGGMRSITGVDFRRSPEGAGRVVVNLSDPATPASLKQEGNQVIVDFTGVALSEQVMKRYDVVDFATPVTMFDAMRVGDNARLVVTATGDFEQLAYQTDNQYVVEVRQRPRATAAVMEKDKVYTGERLTLNFQDIDVRPLLQLLADTSGQNIVVSDSVKGRVTLRLQNVPWDQALDIVLRTKGLDMRRKDNVILVAPQAELAANEKALLEAQKDIHELAPLRTEFLTVNYAKASEIARLVKSAGGGSLLSTRGNVTVDERTNTLLVQDTAENLTAVRSMVATLDIPVRQVLIESRIVIVADDFSRELGVRAGFTRVSDDVSDLFAISGSAQSTDSIMGSALDNLATTGQPYPGGSAVRQLRPLQREHAGIEPGGPHRAVDPRFRRLPDRPRAVGGAERGPRRDQVHAARHHGEPARGDHRAGRRDPVPGVGVLGRDDHAVQEGGAVAQGDAADHAGRPRDPRPGGHQGQRRPAGAERDRRLRALDRHAQHPDPGARQGRPDGRAGRHHGDGAPRGRAEGAGPRRRAADRQPVQVQEPDQ